jgi:hypothetical protein
MRTDSAPVRPGRRIAGFLEVFLLFLAASCTSVGVTRVKSAPSRASNCDLQVFTSEQEVTRPFEVVCLIDSQTGGTIFHDRTAAAAVEHARPYACRCGADGILISGIGREGPGMGSGWGHGTAVVKAIRFTERNPGQR